MGKKFVGLCSNGAKVFDRNDGHNAIHLVDTSLLQEALSNLSPYKDFEVFCFDFGRIIGKTNCVSVDETDTIVMAYRKGRKGPTPLVLNRVSQDCSSLVVILKKTSDNTYVLITYYIDKLAEKEPWDSSLIPGSEEHKRAVAFWSTHALIYDENIIDHLA